MKLKKLMNDFLQNYLEENGIQFEDWSINVNNQDGFGDYSSNIALKLTKQGSLYPEYVDFFINRDKEMIMDSILSDLNAMQKNVIKRFFWKLIKFSFRVSLYYC